MGTSDVTLYAIYQRMDVSPANVTIDLSSGTTTQSITVTGLNYGTVTYSSDDTTVATVSAAGVITGVANGTATITVTGTNGSHVVTKTIPVTVVTTPTSITLNESEIIIGTESGYNQASIQATILPATANSQNTVTWTSNNTSVATVVASGVNTTSATITGVAEGQTIVTARTANGQIANITVKVDSTAPTVAISMDNNNWAKSHTATITVTDALAGLPSTQTIRYAWSLDNTNPPAANSADWQTVALTATEGDLSASATVTKNTGTGEYYLWVDSGVKDRLNNQSASSTVSSVVAKLDNTRPTISTTTPASMRANSSTVITLPIKVTDIHSGIDTDNASDTLTADEIVIKVNDVEVTPTTKTVTYNSVSNGEYSYTLTLCGVSGAGRLSIEYLPRALVDRAGNQSIRTINNSHIYMDSSSFNCTITANETSPTNASSIIYTFTFDKPTTTFSRADITVTNGTITVFNTSSSSVYTATVTNTGTCIQTVGVINGSCTDQYGNVVEPVTPLQISIDRTAPSAPAITVKDTATNSTKGSVASGATGTVYTGATNNYLTPTSTDDSAEGVGQGTIVKYEVSTSSDFTNATEVNSGDDFDFTATTAGTTYYVRAIDQAGNVSTATTVTVLKVTLAVSPATATIENDTTTNLTATGDNTGTITWTSSDDTVATVSSAGVVTAHKVGTATITATSGNDSTVTATSTITVTPGLVTIPTAVTGLVYNGQSQTGVPASSNGKYTITNNTQTNAGTYTATVSLSDPTNYKWADNTTADKQITWEIAKKTLTPSVSGTITKVYDGTTAVTAGQASISLSGAVTGESPTATATYAYDNANAGTGKTVTASTIALTGNWGDNYELSTTTATTTGTITKQQVNPVTNLQVNTAGIVTWTNSSNATGYEISIDGTAWTAATSGEDYLSTITSTTGSRTVYVRAINSDTTNYNSPSTEETVAVTVVTLTVARNNTSYGTVSDNTYNVISGVTYTTSGNTLTVNSGATQLKQITATETQATGYTTTFTSWTPSTGTITTNTTVTANFTRTAINYTLAFDVDGGAYAQGVSNPSTYTIEDAITLNPVSKTGFNFIGWKLMTLNGENVVDGPVVNAIPVGTTGNRTYKAQYSNGQVSYTVYHMLQNADDNNYVNIDTATITATTGDTVTLGSSLTSTITDNTLIANATYSSATDEGGNTPASVTVAADSSTKIYVYYTRNTYALTLVAGNNVSAVSGSGTYRYGQTVSILATLENLPGYTYTNFAWTTTNSSILTDATAVSTTLTMPASATTVTASQTRTVIDYTITYTLNDGTVTGTNPTTYTVESAAITLINPTKTGYTFAGWTGTGLNQATVNVTIPTGSTGNRSYEATWTINSYTVTYDYNGGQVSSTNPAITSTETVDYNDPIDLTKTAYRDGYTLIGWNTDSTASTGLSSLTMGTANVTVYAIYQKLDVSPEIVTIDLSSGTTTQNITVTGLNMGTVTYSSSDNTVATVSNAGVITGVANGIATITVTSTNGSSVISKTIQVTVLTTPTSVTLSDNEIIIGTESGYNTAAVTATVNPSTANSQNTVTFTSNNTSIATVSGSGTTGTITGVADGQTIVTATTANGQTANVTVKVDGTAPIVAVSMDNNNWAKSHTATITVTDALAGLPSTQTIRYAWSLDNTNPPAANSADWQTVALTATEGDLSASATVTKNTGTGEYYLWVDSGVKDRLNNQSASSTVSSVVAKLDNTRPRISWGREGNFIRANVNSTILIYITITDIHSGLYTGNTADAFTADDLIIKVGGTVVNPTTKTLTLTTEANGVYNYTLTLSGVPGKGTLRIELPANSFMDNATNQNNLGSYGTPITMDSTSFTCTITASETSPTNASSIIYTFTFDKPTTTFSQGDITVTNGTKASFTNVSSSVYTARVTNTGTCIQTVGVANGSCTDLYGNVVEPVTPLQISIDRTAPSAPAITVKDTATDSTKGSVASGAAGTVYTGATNNYLTPTSTDDSAEGVGQGTIVKYEVSTSSDFTNATEVNSGDDFDFTATTAGTTYYVRAIDQAGNVSTATTVTVLKVTLAVSPATATIENDTTTNLTATGDNTGTITWTSSDDTVATVSSAGVVTAHKVGTATITATSGNDSTVTATSTITVTPGLVTIPTAVTGLVYNGQSQTGVPASSNGKYTITNNTQTNAGTYTATVSLSDPTNYKWADNTTADKQITWEIAKKTLTPSVSGTITKVYDGTTAVTAGQASISLSGAVTGESPTATATYAYDNANAGTGKTVTASTIALTGNWGDNYELSTTTATTTGTITKAQGIVSVTMADWYEGEIHLGPVIVLDVISGVTASYTYYTDSACTIQTTTADGASTTGGEPSVAGTYYVKATLSDLVNYEVVTATDDFTIYASNYEEVTSGGTHVAYYSTLADAFTNATSGNTIKPLKNNWTDTSTSDPTIVAGKSIILDLNGKTLTLGRNIVNRGTLDIYSSVAGSDTTNGAIIQTSANRIVANYGTFTTNNTSSTNKISLLNTSTTTSGRVMINLVGATATLNNNSVLKFTNALAGNPSTARYVVNNAGGLLTVQGATIINTASNSQYDEGLLNGTSGSTDVSGARIIITSGSITTGGKAVHNSAATGNTIATAAVTISEDTGTTTITSSNSNTISNNNSGLVYITAGTITQTGSNSVINNDSSGTVTVTGGTITGTGTGAYAIINNTSSSGIVNVAGGQLTALGGIGNVAGGTINVTGGTIEGTTNSGIYSTSGTVTIGTNEQTPSVSTTVPSITGAIYGVNAVDTTFNFYDGIIVGAYENNTGKSINKYPDATPVGYAVYKTHTTTQEGAYLVQANYGEYGSTWVRGYNTLSEAFDNSTSGNIIKPLRNVNDQSASSPTLPAAKSIRLILDDYTITMNTTITNNGTLTIEGDTYIYNANSTVINNTGSLTVMDSQIVSGATNQYTIVNSGTYYNAYSEIISTNYRAIHNTGTGTATIYGTVTAADYAIYNDSVGTTNTDAVYIAGATTEIRSRQSNAIYNDSTGTVNSSSGNIYGCGTYNGNIGYAAYNNGAGTIRLGTENIYNGIANYGSGTIEMVMTTVESRGVYNFGNGTININGGTIRSASVGVSNQGTGTINISGVHSMSNIGIGVQNSGSGTINMTGDITLNNPGTGIEATNGTVNVTWATTITTTTGIGVKINGATATVTLGENNGTVESNNPTITTSGVGVQVLQGNFYFYDGTIKGSYSNSTGHSIDGTVTGKPDGYVVNKTVSGSQETATLVPAKYTEYNGNTVVAEYLTLSDAFTNATSGNTIKVNSNTTEYSSASVSSGKSLTLELDGKTINMRSYCIQSSATAFTIQDSSSGATGVITSSNSSYTIVVPNGSTTIKSGTIVNTGTGGCAILCPSPVTLVIGDSATTLNTNNPTIRDSNGSGISLSTIARLEFNNGIIKGTTYAINNNTSYEPTPRTGHTIIIGSETVSGTTYETAILVPGYYAVYNGSTFEGSYATLAEAFTAVPSSSTRTVKVLADTTETTAASLASGKTVTLDLNGKTITTTSNVSTISNAGTLTIQDSVGSGTIQNTLTTASANVIENSGTLTLGGSNNFNVRTSTTGTPATSNTATHSVINNTGTATLNKGTIEQTGILETGTIYRYVIHNSGTLTISGATINNVTDASSHTTIYDRGIRTSGSGTLTVGTGAQITTYSVAINSASSASNEANPATNITGGTITSTNQSAVLNSGTGLVLVNGSGASLSGVTYGINNYNTGSVKVADGTISASGTSTNYAALYNSENKTTGTITVTGGTLSGKNGIRNNKSSGSVIVTGGTITATDIGIKNQTGTLTIGTNEATPSVSGLVPSITGTTSGVKVEGGTFNFYDGIIKGSSGKSIVDGSNAATLPSDTPTGYNVTKLPDNGNEIAILTTGNYVMFDNDGTYLSSYSTLASAFSAVTGTKRIMLAADTTETTTASLGSETTVKLDLNGKTITTSNRITNNGTLDIYNTSSTEGKIESSATTVIKNSGTLTMNDTSDTGLVTVTGTSASVSARALVNDAGKTATLNENVKIEFSTASETTSGSSYKWVVSNSGTLNINGATIENNPTIGTKSGYDRGVTNAGTANLIMTSGSITSQGVGLNNSSSATPAVEISGGSIYANASTGIYISNGEVIMTGGTASGTINGANIANANGTFTLGTDDATVTSNASGATPTEPFVRARNSDGKGVNVTSGATFNFYDGVVRGGYSGGTGYSIVGTVTGLPTQASGTYGVDKSQSGSVETAVLVQTSQQNNIQQPMSMMSVPNTSNTMSSPSTSNTMNTSTPKSLSLKSNLLKGISVVADLSEDGGESNSGATETTEVSNESTQTENTEQSEQSEKSEKSEELTSNSEENQNLNQETQTTLESNAAEIDKVDEPTQVAEPTKVAQVGDTSYETFNSAMSAVLESGLEIKLLEDISLQEEVTIPSGKNVTMNLNGKTLSSTAINTINNNGTLTINSMGIIKNESSNGNVIYNAGTLNMNNGVITTEANGGKGIYNNLATINMNGGKVVTQGIGSFAIYNSGSSSKLVIKDGIAEVHGDGSMAVYNDGKLTMSKGNIVVSADDSTGIYNSKNAIECVIKDVEIMVKAKFIDKYEEIKNTNEFKEELAKMKPSYGIYNDSSKNVVIESSTIKVQRLKGIGIMNASTGSIVLGKKEEVYNSSLPIIYAIDDYTTAISNTSTGKFLMYDGRILNASSIKGVIDSENVKAGYELSEEKNSGYIILSLSKIIKDAIEASEANQANESNDATKGNETAEGNSTTATPAKAPAESTEQTETNTPEETQTQPKDNKSTEISAEAKAEISSQPTSTDTETKKD